MAQRSDDPDSNQDSTQGAPGRGEGDHTLNDCDELRARVGELERFRTLLHYSTDAIFLVEGDTGAIVDANRTASRYLNLDRERLKRSSLADFLPDTSWTDLKADARSAGGDPAQGLVLERELSPAGGASFTVEMTIDRHRLGETDYAVVVVRDMTDRKQAEADLQESEEAFRSLAENSIQGLAIFQEGRIVYANRAIEAIIGYTREEMLAATPETIAEVIHPDDRDRVWQNMLSRLRGEPTESNYEYRILRENGTIRWVEIFASVSKYRGLPAVQVAYFDVTERKEAEEALRANEERYRLLAENSQDVIWTMTLDGRFSYVSPSVERFSGFTPEEVRRLPLHEYLTPESAAEVGRLLADQLALPPEARLSATRVDTQQVTKDGDLRDVEVIATWILDAAGTPVGVQGISRDITERKQAREALRESEQRLAYALVATRDGLWDWNFQTGVVYFSPNYYTMLGYEPDERPPSSETWRSLVHPEDLPRAEDVVEEILTSRREGFAIEFRMGTKEGGWLWVLSRGKVVERDEEGAPVRMVGTHTDITDRKQAEAERAKLEEQLRQSTKMEAIGRLAGGVAHDFNNLLTGINGYAQLILDDLAPEDPLREEIREILDAGERAGHLTEQLLAFSRKQIISPRVVAVNGVIDRATKMLRRIIGEDVELVFSPGPEPLRAKLDPGQADQILVNLATNARDAMPDGGRLTIGTVAIDLDEPENPTGSHGSEGGSRKHVMIVVSDTGHGMDRETTAQIFEPFFSTKARGRGTGLGLSTVYGIVTQNKGRISAISEPGVGTTFKIYFPCVFEEADVPEVRTGPLPRGRETILLVEDDPGVRRLALRILKNYGYDVLEAGSGVEALAISTAEDAIELLVSDVVMPGMNGRELYERLLSDRPSLRVLYMSGYTDDVIAQHGVLDEKTHFVQKPFSVETLILQVRHALDADT